LPTSTLKNQPTPRPPSQERGKKKANKGQEERRGREKKETLQEVASKFAEKSFSCC